MISGMKFIECILNFTPPMWTARGSWVWQRFGVERLADLPTRITPELVRECIRKLKLGKPCDAQDHAVAEMLREAPEELSIALAGISELRLLNSATEDDEEQWNVYEVTLIPKKVAPKLATDFRPVAIIPVLRKLYFLVLGRLMNTRTIPLGNWQFAFR